MSQHPTLGHGKVCYIELPSRDVKESAAFYRNVFAWNIRERSDGEVSFDDGVMEVSGLENRSEAGYGVGHLCVFNGRRY